MRQGNDVILINRIAEVYSSRCNNEIINREDIKTAVKFGIDWADENPVCPWKKTKDDLPCDYPNVITDVYGITMTEEVLVRTENNNYYVTTMQQNEFGEWYWSEETDKIIEWMFIPIPKLEED